MLRLAFDFIITLRETRTRPNAYEATGYITRKIKDMLQEKTAKYFLKYRHDGHTSHLTGRNKNMGWK